MYHCMGNKYTNSDNHVNALEANSGDHSFLMYGEHHMPTLMNLSVMVCSVLCLQKYQTTYNNNNNYSLYSANHSSLCSPRFTY